MKFFAELDTKLFTRHSLHYTYDPMNPILEILDIPIYMSLGISPAEQALPQKVLVSVKLNNEMQQKAEITDKIEDTICYVTIAELIERTCQQKSYHLIEHAAAEVLKALQKAFPFVKFQVRFHKTRPPHRLLHGGTIYTTGDLNL